MGKVVKFFFGSAAIASEEPAETSGKSAGGPKLSITIEGITVKNGKADIGAGIYSEGVALTLDSLVVTGCEAKIGAGIYAFDSELVMNSCSIGKNKAEICGGGLFFDSCPDAQLTDLTIADNGAGDKPSVDATDEDNKDQASSNSGFIMDELETGRPSAKAQAPPASGSIMDELETGRPRARVTPGSGSSGGESVFKRSGWPNEYIIQSIPGGLIPVDDKEIFSGASLAKLLLESYLSMPSIVYQPIIVERDLLLTSSDATQTASDLSFTEFNTDKLIFTGGGTVLLNSNDVKLEGVEFRDNSSQRDGGGLSLFNSDNVIISDSKVTGNVAGQNGAGISMRESHGIKVKKSSFKSNKAALNGGAFFQRSYFLTLPKGASWGEIGNSAFIGNSAPYGAALEITVSRWTFNENSFKQNIAHPYMVFANTPSDTHTVVPLTFYDKSVVNMSSTSSSVTSGASWLLVSSNTFEGNVVNGGSVLRLAVTDKSHQHNISLRGNTFLDDRVENGAVVAVDEGWKLVAPDGKEYECTQCLKENWRRQRLPGGGSEQGIDGAIKITRSGEADPSFWAMIYVITGGEIDGFTLFWPPAADELPKRSGSPNRSFERAPEMKLILPGR